MASTTNLNLELIQGSDVVDYGRLNSWMNKIDEMGAEYVKKRGNKDDWWYRIWSTNRCECGVDNRRKYNSLGFNSRYGNNDLWIPGSRIQPFGTYPVKFFARPYASICFNYCTEKASLIVIQSNTPGSDNSPEFVMANSGQTTLNDVQLSIFCTGNASEVRL